LRPKADSVLRGLLLSKRRIVLHHVIEIVHRIPSVTQPVVAKTLWTVGFISQERVPEAAQCVGSRFMRTGVRIDVPKFLQRWMQVATQNIDAKY
jgi:hypothetical protein